MITAHKAGKELAEAAHVKVLVVRLKLFVESILATQGEVFFFALVTFDNLEHSIDQTTCVVCRGRGLGILVFECGAVERHWIFVC